MPEPRRFPPPVVDSNSEVPNGRHRRAARRSVGIRRHPWLPDRGRLRCIRLLRFDLNLSGLIRKDDIEMVVPKAIEFVATDRALTIAPEPYRPIAH